MFGQSCFILLRDVVIRLAHFSDLHLTATPLGLTIRDYLSKRLIGWLNHQGRRRKSFAQAETILGQFLEELKNERFDHVIFTGDATTLGLKREYQTLMQTFGNFEVLPEGVATPGNHDYYTRRSRRSGLFEATFAKWLQGIRVGPWPYPFAKKVGNYWLVMVNSAQPNSVPWDSRGRVGKKQRSLLIELFKQLSEEPKILVTHYPLLLESGKKEHRWRRCRDAQQLAEIARQHGVRLWVHGHRHTPYFLPAEGDRPFHLCCAGSMTQSTRWSYAIYELEEDRLRIHRRKWNEQLGQFENSPEASIEVTLGV
jgi:3',5'-cyclic AMP phosphodiesterase CpdA